MVGMRKAGLIVTAISSLVALSLVATACQTGSTVKSATPGPSRTPKPHPAHVSISPANNKANAEPGQGITVTVAHGTLTAVSASANGVPVPGEMTNDATGWHSRWALATGTRYMVRAAAIDAAGTSVTRTSTFQTLTPSRTFTTSIFEGAGKSYGVGMPIILQFSSPIVDKQAVERSLEVRTSVPVVGAWFWDGDQTLYFRPRDYWPADTKVDFTGHLDGVQSAPGVYGVHTLTQSFVIGRSLIAVADTRTHHVKIYLDKHLFGNWPMSSGRPGDDTPNGTYLSMDKTNPEEMIGPGYHILVPWSVRFTLSGDFMHDAYWSVSQQGFQNVSHGCVNLSPADAETYYKMSIQGDPVTITGSPKAGKWGDGWTVWFLSWSQLLDGSSLHQAVRAGLHGSSFVNRGAVRPSHAKPPLRTSHNGNADATA